jgi:ligand-binding sensor domain-containing protein
MMTVRSPRSEIRGVLLGVLLMATPHLGLRTSDAQSRWRPEDRAIVGAMLDIFAVATSFERLYVVSADQVLFRDQGRSEWSGPFPGPGLARAQDARGSIVDPLDRSLWVVTTVGWLHYDPTLEIWEQGFTGETILAAGFDRTHPVDGLYLRLARGWVVATRGGGSALPATQAPRAADFVRFTTIEDAARANPQLAGALSGTLMGPGLRPVRLTAAAPAADQSGWWLGTDGAGLLWLPFGSVSPEPRPWGMPGDVVGAVAAVPGGVWAVTDRSFDAGAALVQVPDDLATTKWFFGDQVFGQPFRQVRALHVVDSLLWLGTDQGAIALSPRGERVRWLTDRDGLADRRVLSIAARRGRVVFGTAAGVAELSDSGVTRIAPSYIGPAFSVAIAGDTTWVGTALGLFAAMPGGSDIRQAPGWDALGVLRTPVTALLWRGDTLVALTEHAILWRDPRNGAWTAGPDPSIQVGHGRALADGRNGVWIAGSNAVGFARLGGPVERQLRVGDALPAESWDLSVEGKWLWVATSKGLVRFRRDGVEP